MLKLVVNMRDSETLPHKLTVTKFEEIELRIKYDSVASTFKIRMYFDPNNKVHAELAAVSHIHECYIYWEHDAVGTFINDSGKFVRTKDQLIFTGFMLSQIFHSSSKPSLMEIGGYSKAGVLGDCDFPKDAYPLESNGLSFRQIIKQKVMPYFSNPDRGGFEFKIKSTRADSVFTDESSTSDLNSLFGTSRRSNSLAELNSILAGIEDDADSDIGKTTAYEAKNILSYLRELALQKDLTLSHDVLGNLVVNVPYTGNDYLFEVGTERGVKFIDMTSNYNGQGLHSQIEAIRQPDKNGGNFAYAIVRNPFVPVVYRPKMITINSGDDNTIKKALRSELGAELKSIPLTISLESPVVHGKFILPNNTVRVKNREVYLYEPSKWFIEEIVYVDKPQETTCTVTCVPPGVYSGGIYPSKSNPDEFNTDIKNPFISPHENLPRV